MSTAVRTVAIGEPLTYGDVVAVSRDDARVNLIQQGRVRIVDVRRFVDTMAASSEPVYGISTGFGAMANKQIPPEQRTQLQRSLIQSHAAGSGPIVERE